MPRIVSQVQVSGFRYKVCDDHVFAWHLTPETCSRNDVLLDPARKAARLGHLAQRARCKPPHEPAWGSGRKFRKGNQAASALLEGQVGLAACADESTG